MIYFARIEFGTFRVHASHLDRPSWDAHRHLLRRKEPRTIFFVKIGTSDDPEARMKSLEREYGRPVRLLAMLPGGKDEETAMHRRFDHLRLEQIGRTPEWFYPTKELMGFIRSLQENPAIGLDVVMTTSYIVSC